MKTNFLPVLLLLFLGFTNFEFARLYFNERGNSKRLTDSFRAAEQDLKTFKTRNGQLAYKNDLLQLQVSELKSIYPGIIEEIRSLDIRPKTVKQFTQTVIRQEKVIQTVLRDSVLMDTIPAKIFDYQDAFYCVKGIAVGDSQVVKISSIDSLVQVVYYGDRVHPWMWIFSKRKLQQVITSQNPNSKILYHNTIEISKK
ncbi:MAG: DUF6549 family protein [Bacteroidales bacterium]